MKEDRLGGVKDMKMACDGTATTATSTDGSYEKNKNVEKFGAFGVIQDDGFFSTVPLSREEYIGIIERTNLSPNARSQGGSGDGVGGGRGRRAGGRLKQQRISHSLRARMLGRQHDVVLLELVRHTTKSTSDKNIIIEDTITNNANESSPSRRLVNNTEDTLLLRCMLLWPSSTLFMNGHESKLKQVFLGGLSHISDSIRATCVIKNAGFLPEDIPSSLEETPFMKQDSMNFLKKGAIEMLCQMYETGKSLKQLFPNTSTSSSIPVDDPITTEVGITSAEKNDIFRSRGGGTATTGGSPKSSTIRMRGGGGGPKRRAETFLCCITTDDEAHFFRTADLLFDVKDQQQHERSLLRTLSQKSSSHEDSMMDHDDKDNVTKKNTKKKSISDLDNVRSKVLSYILLGDTCQHDYLMWVERARLALEKPYFTIDLKSSVFPQIQQQKQQMQQRRKQRDAHHDKPLSAPASIPEPPSSPMKLTRKLRAITDSETMKSSFGAESEHDREYEKIIIEVDDVTSSTTTNINASVNMKQSTRTARRKSVARTITAGRGNSAMLRTLPKSSSRHLLRASRIDALDQSSPDKREEMIAIHSKLRRQYETAHEGMSTSDRALSTIVASRSQSTDDGENDDESHNDIDESHTLQPSQSEVQGETYERFENIIAKPIEISADYKPPYFPKKDEEKIFLQACISDNFIFIGMDSNEKTLLINAMEPITVSKQTILCKQGETGDYFYVLADGRVSFHIDGKEVGQVHAPAIFGEMSLLYDSPRAATCIIESSQCDLYRVGQEGFKAMMAHNKANASQDNINTLRSVSIFKDLDMKALMKISDAMTMIRFKPGEIIINKGTVGRVFYIIKEGKVIVHDIGIGKSHFEDQTLGVGDFFGERALMTGDTRAANVTAQTDCTVLCLSRDSFCRIVGPLEDLMIRAIKRRRLMGLPIIAKANLASFEVDLLVDELQPIDYIPYEVIRINEDNLGIYFVTKGVISASTAVDSNDEENSKINAINFVHGDYIDCMSAVGERSTKKSTTVPFAVLRVVGNEPAQSYYISREAILNVLGTAGRLYCDKQDAKGQQPTQEVVKFESLHDLKRWRILGQGTFGQVWLVTDARTRNKKDKPYALKIQAKRQLISQGLVDGVLRERNLMSILNHPFIIKLYGSFQDKRCLYMVTNLCPGGELFSRLHTDDTNGIDEPSAKFYAACIVSALAYLHQRNILYRDLKAENALIDKDGYCILIDLGYAKEIAHYTYTMCGTPLYIAPEIILSRGYNAAVDYWSFGVLIFEMIHGFSPFYAKGIDQQRLFQRIIKGKYKIPKWSNASDEAKDLIARLLVIRPSERLGLLANGDADVLCHPWFQKDINFTQLTKKQMEPPWIPPLKTPTSAMFENWDHLEDMSTTKDKALNWFEQRMFREF